MSTILRSCSLVGMAIAVSACGGPSPTIGGTTGEVRVAGQPLGDLEVAIYQASGSDWELVGSGVSQPSGEFRLIQPKAMAALWLPPGNYRATVHSVGPETLRFPMEYQQPATSPLIVDWEANSSSIQLEMPAPLPARRP